jgi:hypothetical protein
MSALGVSLARRRHRNEQFQGLVWSTPVARCLRKVVHSPKPTWPIRGRGSLASLWKDYAQRSTLLATAESESMISFSGNPIYLNELSRHVAGNRLVTASAADPMIFFFMLSPLPLSTRHSTLAPSHLMTLSACASAFGGIVRPICFAVFKLITSSNLVDCSTGRSAGLAPLRNLST